jgi:hypothetical protein
MKKDNFSTYVHLETEFSFFFSAFFSADYSQANRKTTRKGLGNAGAP